MKTLDDVACTVCGCVCDDLSLTFAGDRLVAGENVCPLARPWFEALNDERWPACSLRGASASVDEGIAAAADLLRGSRNPLVFGLARSSTPGQRAAVRLAERLGGTIDTTASVCHGPSIMAIQEVGESTCTLGEIRNRSDLVLFWGADPAVSHPRHFERYSVDCEGLFTPNGRADRRVIVIDHQPTATSELADRFIQLPPDGDMEAIVILRMLLAGQAIDADQGWLGSSPQGAAPGRGAFERRSLGASLRSTPATPHTLRSTPATPSIDLTQLESLADELKSCRYGVVFFGLGLAQLPQGHAHVTELLRLVAELNDHTRFVARRLRIPGDVAGADSVLCWQTGFPYAVNFTRGYPRYNPGEYTADALLSSGEADACLLVGSESVPLLSEAARGHLKRIPVIALDYPHLDRPIAADVHFTTAVYGIHAAGTAYRMDEMPIPLRALVETELPTDEAVLARIGATL